jgi:hypothetical protein
LLTRSELSSRLEAAQAGAARGGHIQLTQTLLAAVEERLTGEGAGAAEVKMRILDSALKEARVGQIRYGSMVRGMRPRLETAHQKMMEEAEGIACTSPLPLPDWDSVIQLLTDAKENAAKGGEHA